MRRDREDAAHPPHVSPSLPTATITHRWAFIGYVVSIKGDRVEGERVGHHRSLEGCSCSCSYLLYAFIASCNNLLPLALEAVYNGHTDTALHRHANQGEPCPCLNQHRIVLSPHCAA